MITIYHNIIFPSCISQNAVCKKEYRTQILTTKGGREQRGIEWLTHLRKFDIGTGIKCSTDLQKVIELFHVCNGADKGFLLKDWTDYRCGVGNTLDYQNMVQDPIDPLKWYFFKSASIVDTDSTTLTRDDAYHCRFIIADTVNVQVAGTSVNNYTLSVPNGYIIFDTLPASTPRAIFEYNVAVRFITDSIDELYNWSGVGSISCILEQIKLPYRFELEDNLYYYTTTTYPLLPIDSTTVNPDLQSVNVFGILGEDSLTVASEITSLEVPVVIITNETDAEALRINAVHAISGQTVSIIVENEVDSEAVKITSARPAHGTIVTIVLTHDITANEVDNPRIADTDISAISGTITTI